MRYAPLWFALKLVLLESFLRVSSSFTTSSWRPSPTARYLGSFTASSTARASSLSSEIFLLSFDGTVAKTTEWRIQQGIELAFSVWPNLEEMNVIAEDDEWLRNKMRAVSSVMVSRPGCSLSVDYALLARLLLEEQELDQGRSNGSSGKYGSKFHPQSTSSSSSPARNDGRGSRPLTVGEITENWNKGGCLADTVLTKYHIDYEDPLPILQQRVDDLNKEIQSLPKLNEAVLDALHDSSGNIIVTVGHESDIPVAQRTLEAVGIATTVLPAEGESAPELLETRDNAIILLPIRTSHGATYRDVLQNAPVASTVYVFESSWQAMEQGIHLFGDNIPRTGSGMAETILGRDVQLSLNFPKWSTTAASRNSQSKSPGDVAQQNEAMMNPWTNLVAERDFSELLSARIIPSSL